MNYIATSPKMSGGAKRHHSSLGLLLPSLRDTTSKLLGNISQYQLAFIPSAGEFHV